jgi:outer membrane receptor for ferric coprogen and ferric-rhodotorulic acid
MNISTQNIYDPDPYITEPDVTFPGVGPGFNLNTIQTDTQYGGYVRWKVTPVSRLNLIAGTRLSNYHSETQDTGRNTSSEYRENGQFTPFGGITFDITNQVTAYTSYSEIYQPQSDLTIDAEVVGPRTGRQVEAGLKGSFLDGALNAQAGAYWLRDENRAVADPNNVGFFVATGKATTYGVEALVAGEPMPGLNIWASYAFTETDLDSGGDDEFGEITPTHAGTVWAKYTIQGGTFGGLSFGGGVRAVGEMHSISNGVTITAPSYVVADAQVGYALNEHLSATATVNNIFDKKYYERVNETERGNFYGAPRNFMLRVTGKF